MSEITNLKESKKQATSIDANEVILNIQKAALDIYTVIDRFVKPKYPDKAIKMPSQEEAKQKHKGWEYLRYDSANQTCEVVGSIDKAFTTQSNVLCWRDKRIQDYIDSEDKRKRDTASRYAQDESTKTQAAGLDSALKGLGQGKIRAKPLEEKEDE